jgi:chromosome segregation ATPase
MGSSFVQASTERASRLQRVVQASSKVDDYQRNQILDLLQGKQNPFGDYSSQSGEIVGILKAMKDEMDSDLGGVVKDEESAVASFEGMASAKKSEIAAASEAIEAKTARSGELAVAVTVTADDIEDTTAEMSDTNAFLANLKSSCETKKKEWAERTQVRAEEISAISEAIKVLNDDDALDLFKKTLALPQLAMGFLQKKSSMSLALRAKDIVTSLKKKGGVHATQLALLEYSLSSKKVDFSKVVAMIDGMVAVLGKEQESDDTQKSFCDGEIAKSEDEKAATETAIASSESAIEEMTSSSASLADELASLQAEVKALDLAVAEATEQRKEEHGEFLQFQTENSAAVQLVEKAKNHLYKFYRPNLHKEAPKKELTDEEKILAASGRSDMIATDAPVMIAGTTQTVFVQLKDDAAPPPPPETWGAYQKKDGKSNGVLALMDMLIKELQDGITDSKHEEETSQKDYERLMSESQATREQNVESIASKEAAKADMDTKIETTKEAKASQEAELSNIKGYITQLHAQCDFLIDNYDLRKAARVNEVESLKNAKGVLSGANFA